MNPTYGEHKSVLTQECLFYLSENIKKDNPCFADLTFGAGGHSLALLEKLPSATVWAVDQDLEAITNGEKLIESRGLSKNLFLQHMNFLQKLV